MNLISNHISGLFDVSENKLEGSNLIEASAGTGKTFNIERIVLRLILEKNILLNEILVVTFTVAATSELRERIHEIINKSCNVFKEHIAGIPGEDIFSLNGIDESLSVILVKHFGEAERSLVRLQSALRDFEDSSILTIHGFCSKILSEFAFESRGILEAEISNSTELLSERIINDEWRRLTHSLTKEKLENLLSDASCYGKFKTGASACVNSSADSIFRLADKGYEEKIQSSEIEKHKLIQAYTKNWNTSKTEIIKFLNGDTLNKNSYKSSTVKIMIEEIDAFCENNNFDEFSKIELFTKSKAEKALKKGHTYVPEFFQSTEKLKQLHDSIEEMKAYEFYRLYTECFVKIADRVKQEKEKTGFYNFNDLIFRLHNALTNQDYGHILSNKIQSRYKAALIDEFQDTDKIQWEIFKILFLNESKILFVIGDPKQSIYRFRGADINVYLEAKKQIKNQYTLLKNYRSTKELLESLNYIYGNFRTINSDYEPFKNSSIEYHDAVYAKQHEEILYVNSEEEKPLHIFSVKNEEIPIEEARDRIFKKTVDLIVSLLDHNKSGFLNKNTKSKRPVLQNEIAVLVTKKKYAEKIQKLLYQKSVVSVIQTENSVFETTEASSLLLMLKAADRSTDISAVTEFLSNYISGWNILDLEKSFNAEAKILEDLMISFQNLRTIRENKGFMAMFNHMIDEIPLTPKGLTAGEYISGLPGGERIITNMNHLAELINTREKKIHKRTLSDDIRWLSREMNESREKKSDEQQIRLESDREAVSIMTVHKSKGLEFPIVILPVMWEDISGSFKNDDVVILENKDSMFIPSETAKFILHSKLNELSEIKNKISEALLISTVQEDEEKMRLLYVAMTRPVHKLYMFLGELRGWSNSSARWLFCGGSETINNENSYTLESLFADINKNLCSASSIDELEEQLPLDNIKDYELNSPDLSISNIEESYKITSYTGIISRMDTFADYDEKIQNQENIFEFYNESRSKSALSRDEDTIFTFDRGSKAGIFLHKIFEEIEFDSSEIVIKNKIKMLLEKYGYDANRWCEPLNKNVMNVLGAVLATNSGLTLRQILNEHRLSEMYFLSGLKFSDWNILKISDEDSDSLRQIKSILNYIKISDLHGYLQGIVDLVFEFKNKYYLLDWKSNHLGDRVEDYEIGNLRSSMNENNYILQYYFYLSSLDIYLKTKLDNYSYDAHIGGVFYLFIRGMNPEKNTGIYFHKPDFDAVDFFQRYTGMKK